MWSPLTTIHNNPCPNSNKNSLQWAWANWYKYWNGSEILPKGSSRTREIKPMAGKEFWFLVTFLIWRAFISRGVLVFSCVIRPKDTALKTGYNHRIMEHPQLERTHKDHQIPTPGPAQDTSTIPPRAWECCLPKETNYPLAALSLRRDSNAVIP